MQCTGFLIYSYNNSVVIITFPWIISLILFGHVKISFLKEQIEVQVNNSYMFQYYWKKKRVDDGSLEAITHFCFLFSLLYFFFFFNLWVALWERFEDQL